ncbi:MAG TPA: tetratricopeptide repeat protein, partial [Verrucomicrobiae bacterium]
DAQILGLVKALASTNSLYYLHPSFGYYFEPFFAEPHRLVYRLQSYPTNMLIKPPLTAELVDQNQKFWSEMSQGVLKQVRTVAELGAQKTKEGPLDRFFRPLLERVHVTRLGNPDALWLAHISSRALNSLGVDLQRQGMYPEAGAHFLDAKELFTNNVAAAINLEFNRALKDNNAPLQQAKRTDEQLGGYRRIQDMMNDNGPVDEPRYCYALGREFFLGNNHRQAAQEFNRVAQLAPEGSADNLSSRLLLARSAMLVGMPDEGLKVINDLHARAAALGLSETNAPDLLQLETIAYFFKSDTNAAIKAIDTTLAAYPTNVSLLDIATTLLVQAGLTNSARKLVETAWTTYPRDVQLLNTVVQGYLGTGMTNTAIQLIDAALTANPGNEAWLAAGTKLYLQAGCYPKALATAEQQLKTRPDNVSASFAKGVACLKLNDFTNSAAAFTTLVRLGTNDFPDLYYPALINRGFAFWKSGKLDEARRDYESLRQSFPNAPQFSYSLGEIAYTKKDTKAAIRNYELFLSRAPTNTAEASNVLARLKELRGGSR